MGSDYYPPPGLSFVGATAETGFDLQNDTPSILTWTAPNDGKTHSIIFFSTLIVSATETGGNVVCNLTIGGQAASILLFAGGQGTGFKRPNAGTDQQVCDPGTTVTLTQTALTAGAATLFATMYAA